MAFTNPFMRVGLAPIASALAADYSGKGRLFYIAPTDTNQYCINDAVTLTGTGDPLHGIPGITLGQPNGPLLGSILALGVNWAGGPYVNPSNTEVTFRPAGAATTAYYALVMCDPMTVYEIQEGGTGTNLTAAALGSNANILYSSPALGAKISGTVLDNTSVGTAATLNLKILEMVQRIDAQFVTTPPGTGGGAQKWWVQIANHCWRPGAAGI